MAEIKEENFKNKLVKTALLALIIFLSPALTRSVNAASLYFSPSSGSFAVGSKFTVVIYVSTTDQAMNAASGVVSYSSDKLELVTLSKNGSVFNLWVAEPSFSQSAGTINFEGIVMNPGYTGANGKLVTATFKVKSDGPVQLRFNSASVLANNGIGTNILNKMGSAQFNAVSEEPAAPKPTTPPAAETPKTETKPVQPAKETTTTEPAAAGVPPLPEIISSSHPDQDKWYNATQAKFNWSLPPGVTAVSLLLGESPNAIPTVIYTPPVAEKVIDNLTDGTWYFSVRFKNSAGWGETARYRLKVDTTPPSDFTIKFVSGQAPTDIRPIVTFTTTDNLSGIDFYKIRVINGLSVEGVEESQNSNLYMLSPQSPGKKTLFVQAFDKAGNYTTNIADFEVKGLEAPILTKYPRELIEGKNFAVEGQTIPNAQVTIWLKREDSNTALGKTTSDGTGRFSLNYTKDSVAGLYKLWAEAQDQLGQRTYPSAEYDLKINPGNTFKLPLWAYNTLLALAVLGVLGFLAILTGRLGKRAVFYRGAVNRQARRANIAFTYLRNSAKRFIRLLESAGRKRRLTKEEKIILANVKKDLLDVETAIKKDARLFKRN